jgi:hypothetical protein
VSATDIAIRRSGLSKDYGQGRGLFDLDLEVQRSEIVGFLVVVAAVELTHRLQGLGGHRANVSACPGWSIRSSCGLSFAACPAADA